MPSRFTLLACATASLTLTGAAVGAATTAHAAPVAATTATAAATTFAGGYHSLNPSRILDTRGAVTTPGPSSTTSVQVLGRGGVPATGVAAVVVNLTAVSPTRGTFVTAYPGGSAQPGVSNLNVEPGVTRANQVTVPVGATGTVSLYNAFGSVDLLVDVLGYYDTDGSCGGLLPLQPMRIFDSRSDEWGARPMEPYEVAQAGLTLSDSQVDPHITALAVNITAIQPEVGGYLSTWDGTEVTGDTSTLNFTAGDTVPNAAIVPVSHVVDPDTGKSYSVIQFGNVAEGGTHVAVDVVGAYTDGAVPDDLRFKPVTPTRILDTRSGVGGLLWFGPNETKPASAPDSLGTADTYGFAGNVTAVSPSSSTFLSLWRQDKPWPGTSSLNTNAGETVANAAFVNADYQVYNAFGRTDVLVDVAGTFDVHPTAAGQHATAAAPNAAPAAPVEPRAVTPMPHTRH